MNNDIDHSYRIKKVEKEFQEKQSELIDDFFNELWYANGCQSIWTDHFHICQFELEQKLFHSKDKNWAKRKCKQHLKPLGVTRDKERWCCDICENNRSCRYMKTFTKNSNGELMFVR